MKKRVLFFICFLLVAIVAIPVVIELGMVQKVEKSLKLQVKSQYVPHFFSSSFGLKNVTFDWDQRVRLLSGDLKVDYELGFPQAGKLQRIKLSGTDLEIKLLGEWSKIQNVSEVKLDTFFADLGIAEQGIREIYQLEANSPQFQFHVRPSE